MNVTFLAPAEAEFLDVTDAPLPDESLPVWRRISNQGRDNFDSRRDAPQQTS